MWEKRKGPTKCEKRTVRCDVGTAQYENRTVKYKNGMVKCEKKVTQYNRLLSNGYRTSSFLGGTVELPILKMFLTHIKFHMNQMLFTIWFIKLFLCIILNCKILKFKHLINGITIDFWSCESFVGIKYIKRKYNSDYEFVKIHI